MLLITGGTGFVGRHLTARLLAESEPVRVLARRPAGMPGVETFAGDVTDLPSLLPAVEGCHAVIHLVGIIREIGGRTYRKVHVQGTANVIEACRQAGVPRLLHMSALGARERAASRYHESKWQAEQLVRASGLAATIFRPSVMFGKGSAFLSTIKQLVEAPPVIPIIGAGTALLQPIWVEDVVSCFVGAHRKDDTAGHTYELGGPETYGFEQLVDIVAEAEGIEKPKLHLPVWMVRPAAALLSHLSARFPLTPDQLTMLLEDNVCDIAGMRQTFGVDPASLRHHLSNG
ncbi:MAG: complex I NDUFA9 subunit family protein [Armatimonadota bacterium]